MDILSSRRPEGKDFFRNRLLQCPIEGELNVLLVVCM